MYLHHLAATSRLTANLQRLSSSFRITVLYFLQNDYEWVQDAVPICKAKYIICLSTALSYRIYRICCSEIASFVPLTV
jgi:hypothetical protein